MDHPKNKRFSRLNSGTGNGDGDSGVRWYVPYVFVPKRSPSRFWTVPIFSRFDRAAGRSKQFVVNIPTIIVLLWLTTTADGVYLSPLLFFSYFVLLLLFVFFFYVQFSVWKFFGLRPIKINRGEKIRTQIHVYTTVRRYNCVWRVIIRTRALCDYKSNEKRNLRLHVSRSAL